MTFCNERIGTDGELLRHLVTERLQVLLRGIGSAKALGGGAERHVVEQALAGGADHGNDVGPLLCRGARLDHVLVDVAGGHDQIEPGCRAFTKGLDAFLAQRTLGGNLLAGGCGQCLRAAARCGFVFGTDQ